VSVDDDVEDDREEDDADADRDCEDILLEKGLVRPRIHGRWRCQSNGTDILRTAAVVAVVVVVVGLPNPRRQDEDEEAVVLGIHHCEYGFVVVLVDVIPWNEKEDLALARVGRRSLTRLNRTRSSSSSSSSCWLLHDMVPLPSLDFKWDEWKQSTKRSFTSRSSRGCGKPTTIHGRTPSDLPCHD
jgi:hypothetical protein